MEAQLRPHEGIMVMHGIVFDPGAGLGASATIRGEATAGLVVAMRPGVFLELATPLTRPRSSLDWLDAHLRAGRAICPGRLRVWLPGQGGSGNPSSPAVVGHDGRHRAMALRAVLGNIELPVRLELPGLEPDAPRLPALADLLRRGMRAQGGLRPWVPGPLFGATSDDLADGVAPLRRTVRIRVRAPPRSVGPKSARRPGMARSATGPRRRAAAMPCRFRPC